MIFRRTDTKDRRIVRIGSTPQGRELLHKINQSFEKVIEQLVDRLGEEDTQTLLYLFKKLYNVLDEMEKEDLLDFE